MYNESYIHEHKQRQMEPFWWVTAFLFSTLGLLLGLTFIIGGPVLFAVYMKTWLLLFILLIPLGIWICIALTRVLKRMVWRNRHLSSYRLGRNQITYHTWNEDNKTDSEGTISFNHIQYVVASIYLIKDNHAYTKSRIAEQVPRMALAPVLYIVYEKNGQQQILTVPFYMDTAINTWLQGLKENQIPLLFSSLNLYDMEDEERFQSIVKGEKQLPFTFEGDWLKQAASLNKEWFSQMEDTTLPEEDNSDEEYQEMMRKEQETKKVHFRAWLRAATRVYPLLIIGSYISIYLGESHIISDDGVLPGLILLIISAYLYFHFQRGHLRKSLMPRFWVESFIICLIHSMFAEKYGTIAEEITTGILGASIIIIVIVWIPYLFVARLRKA
ncbi:hypothetical protein [Oceanobacillus jordanicus]|uniref:DUF2207 domain-containing protein n=1 Tax=Oceanobacillus jordanicus TaxID=2867266 RepID=A0AAW5B4S9_9BACI|nr:hypothetical protein [Oceanobacillus jordanicus]MCG3419287.1 hypothetical protein [Oceanobacillus jordanicus]